MEREAVPARLDSKLYWWLLWRGLFCLHCSCLAGLRPLAKREQLLDAAQSCHAADGRSRERGITDGRHFSVK